MPLLDLASAPTLRDIPALAALAVIGAVASGINAVAGGGSLLSFPALVALGVPPLQANATNALALWPGSISGALGFLNKLEKTKRALYVMILPSAVGGAAGAALLTVTPERAFKLVVPVLVLAATILLAFQPRIRRWSRKEHARMSVGWSVALQLAISIYGGYFGAGMGILMLAVLGLFVEGTIHELNAVKTWLGLLINLVASVFFLGKGLIVLRPGLALMAGAIAGGYFSARLSQRVDAEKLRKGIVGLGLAMAAWFTVDLLRA